MVDLIKRDAIEGWKSPNRNDWMTFRTLMKARGKAVAMMLAEPKSRLYIREMTDTITQLDKEGWSGSTPVKFNENLQNEFKIWLKMEQVKMIHVWRPELLKEEKPAKISFTDASSFAIGIVFFKKNGEKFRYTRYIGEDMIGKPIHIKEAAAIVYMLEDHPEEFMESTVIHYCDNESVVHGYRNMGTSTPELTRWIVKIYELLNEVKSVMR